MTLYKGTIPIAGNSIDDSTLVHKAGAEDITGAKTFVGSTRIYVKSENIENEVPPSGTDQRLNGILFQDKNSKRISSLEFCKTPTGENLLYMIANGWNNDEIVYGNTLGVGISSDGSVQRTFARTPEANSNDNNIATTAWVHSNAAGLVMPSNSYIDFTVGATGSSYTAPDDGWIIINCKTTSNTSNYMSLYCSWLFANYANWNMTAIQPVVKNQTLTLWFLNTTNMTIRFYYSNGTKPN